MPYDRFKSEDELLKSIFPSLAYDGYPKVSVIAGTRVNPDIDILHITKVPGNQRRLIGYELKLMKYNQRSKGLSWHAFYQGIGQTHLYLKNGVHRAVLILGFHENIPDDEQIASFDTWLWDKRNLLSRILGNYISVGTFLYKRGHFSPKIEAKSDFSPPDEETRFLTQALLQGKFTYNKKLKASSA